LGSQYYEAISVTIRKFILDKVDELRAERGDPSRSSTINFLICLGLTVCGKLSPEERKILFPKMEEATK